MLVVQPSDGYHRWSHYRADTHNVTAVVARELSERIESAGHTGIGSYAIPMAYRVRFYMDMNAREAMHMIELRTSPAGHPSYRRVCQTMHRLIAEQAGHTAIAEAMKYVDHGEVELERLEAEKAAEKRRSGI